MAAILKKSITGVIRIFAERCSKGENVEVKIIAFKVSSYLADRIDKISSDRYLSRSDFIRRCIIDGIDKEENGKKKKGKGQKNEK